VTYNGHPLYYYAGDQKPGDIKGQGLNQFGAAWYVLGANGNKIDNG
jgi:predicted lipoprotein with Yx(FWY)xxD motif